MTRAHTTFYLNEEVKCLVFGSATSQFSEEYIKELFDDKLNSQSQRPLMKLQSYFESVGLAEPNQKQLRKVQVKIVDINWLNYNNRKLFSFLSNYHSSEIFTNPLIKILLEE